MGISCCENCSDGVAREGSDQFICGEIGRSNADGLVADCEDKRDKTNVVEVLQWF